MIRCPKWPLLEDDLTIHAWNRWPLAALEWWPLKRVKLYSNISWAGLKMTVSTVTVYLRWPVRHVFCILRKTARSHWLSTILVKSLYNVPHLTVSKNRYHYLFSNNTSNYQSTVHSFNHTAPLYIVITFIWTLSYFFLPHACTAHNRQ